MTKISPTKWRQTQAGDSAVPGSQFPELPDCLSKMQAVSARGDVGDDDAEKLRTIIAHRRLRQVHFSANLFSDPAWDILLDLALAERQQRRVCVSSLCIGAQVPTTTALRWIKHMTEAGWLVRKDDPLDARRKFIELSEETSSKMRAFLSQLS